MKQDLLLFRLNDPDNPLTNEEIHWLTNQLNIQKLVEYLYVEHQNKVLKRKSEITGEPLVELVSFRVQLGDDAQDFSVFEILNDLINFKVV